MIQPTSQWRKRICYFLQHNYKAFIYQINVRKAYWDPPIWSSAYPFFFREWTLVDYFQLKVNGMLTVQYILQNHVYSTGLLVPSQKGLVGSWISFHYVNTTIVRRVRTLAYIMYWIKYIIIIKYKIKERGRYKLGKSDRMSMYDVGSENERNKR